MSSTHYFFYNSPKISTKLMKFYGKIYEAPMLINVIVWLKKVIYFAAIKKSPDTFRITLVIIEQILYSYIFIHSWTFN